MYGYIYKITDLRNDKIYVGKHKSLTFNANQYFGSGKIITNIIKLYGTDILKKELLDTADSIEELNKKEKYWIETLQATDRAIGYNLASGGDGGDIVSGYAWFNDGVTEFFIPKETASETLLTPGRLISLPDATGTVWINNGIIQHQVSEDEANKFLALSQNWHYGMLEHSLEWKNNLAASLAIRNKKASWKENIKKGKQKFSSEHPGWTNSGSWQAGQKAHNKGKVSVTNGINNHYIDKEALEEWLQENPTWWKGNTQKHKGEKIDD